MVRIRWMPKRQASDAAEKWVWRSPVHWNNYLKTLAKSRHRGGARLPPVDGDNFFPHKWGRKNYRGAPMRQDTKVYLDLESEQKLSEFGITRTEAMKVVQRIVAARADAVDDDPLGTAGQFAHIFGTRHIRALLKRVGWVNHREENVESVFHEATKRKIIYKSVDIAGVVAHSPQSSRDIGPGARRLVNAAQGMLFPESELPEQVSTISGDPPCVWYFCVSVDHMPETGDRIVGAELSQPYPFDGDNFGPFIERVIIRKNGPWDGVLIEEDDMADDHAAEFEPAISRK